MIQRKDLLHITIFIWASLFFFTLFTTYTVVILFIPKARVKTTGSATQELSLNSSHISHRFAGANGSQLHIWDIAHFAKLNSQEEYHKLMKHMQDIDDDEALRFDQIKDKVDEIQNFGTGTRGSVYSPPDVERASPDLLQEECRGRLYTENLNVSDISKLSMSIPYLKNYANPCFCDRQGSLACLPSFYVLGAEQCAADVSQVLAAHPLIHSVQAADWWQHYRLSDTPGTVTLRQYMNGYKQAIQTIHHTVTRSHSLHPGLLGDTSPSMLYGSSHTWHSNLPGKKQATTGSLRNTAEVLHSIIPQAKLLVVLCDPIKHFYSQWHLGNGANSTRLFQELNPALQLFRECLSDMSLSYRDCLYGNLDRKDTKSQFSAINQLRAGLYYDFLQDWLAIFPRRQIHIVNYDNFVQNPGKVSDAMFGFLEVFNVEDVKLQEVLKGLTYLHTSQNIKVNEDAKEFLQNFYESHNQVLAEFLHDRTFLWTDENKR